VETYIAMLRGINLGSRKRVAMADLRELFGELGAEDVRTYVQSGNVVFRSGKRAPELARAIAKAVRMSLGLDVTVILRTKAQLAKVVSINPFVKSGVKSGIEPATLHVTFLSEKPSAGRVRELATPAGSDGFEIVGCEVYLRCPNGYGKSKLQNAFFEKQLAVAATTRNWKTVTTLAELARS
jgi:uncharacterized protein (DUF1697 family)